MKRAFVIHRDSVGAQPLSIEETARKYGASKQDVEVVYRFFKARSSGKVASRDGARRNRNRSSSSRKLSRSSK
jgi:hypothetical protein